MGIHNQRTDEDPTHKILVIGIGNTLRSDDGVGHYVIELLNTEPLLGIETMIRHQLTPELAETVATKSLVIFVDASLNVPENEVRMSRIEPETDSQIMAHTANPAGILQLAQCLFDGNPTGWLVEISVTDTGIGETLSPVARQGAKRAVKEITGLIEHQPS